ncbi:MAG: nucleotidyltransferase family protein, partial [Alphaproteobacteria bacterium]|nr:nucleotidyltransferase family protein [Alphaproteobacteria bacterium]
ICGQRSGSKIDTIRLALKNFVDDIVCANIPQTGISDFVVSTRRDVKIVCLPYEYDELHSSLIKRLILQVVASDKLLAINFAHLPNANLPQGMELSIREQARLSGNGAESDSNQNNIAAIVLAAGCSRRAGMNKLLADINGTPLFLKAVHAAIRSKAKPVYVITGYQNEKIEKALENLDVNILHNPSFRSGVKTSIMLGLNSLPSNCKAALLIPADMPNVTERFLNKMIKSYNQNAKEQLLVATHKGTKHNPVLWSRELFKQADIVPEDANIRVIFPQHEDYTTKVETSNKNILLDVTYRGDIEKLQSKDNEA